MDTDKALELLHNCPSIGFGYNCNPRPTYTIEQKDLPILFDYIQQQSQTKNENQMDLTSHSEKEIVKCCISLMNELVGEFQEWYRWQHGEDAIDLLDVEERFCVRKSYFEIVQELLLYHTNHCGGGSTRAKCSDLGFDYSKEIEFGFRQEAEDI